MSLVQDIDSVRALVSVLNAAADIAEEFPRTKSQAALAVANLAQSGLGVYAENKKSRTAEFVSFGASQVLKDIGLIKVAGMTPAKASMYITLTMADKVVSAAGLTKISECKMAVTSLALSVGIGTFTCVGTVGFACVAGAVAVAADAFNVRDKCFDPPSYEKAPVSPVPHPAPG